MLITRRIYIRTIEGKKKIKRSPIVEFARHVTRATIEKQSIRKTRRWIDRRILKLLYLSWCDGARRGEGKNTTDDCRGWQAKEHLFAEARFARGEKDRKGERKKERGEEGKKDRKMIERERE